MTSTSEIVEVLAEQISWLIETSNYKNDQDCARRQQNKLRIQKLVQSILDQVSTSNS